MRSQISLGRFFGIKIGLHYSWFLIAFLIVFSLSSQFHASHPEWGDPLNFALALLTALLFFVCLLLHELAHSVFANSHGMPVREITLFALGGVSQIEKNPTSARTEFWMAFVGPLTSALIGGICIGLRYLAGPASSPASVILSWLGYINLALAGFNMIPGYPLDGGRILRAAIWWKTGDVKRSTILAAKVGQAVGVIFIAIGILQFFSGAGLGGLWIAFIGWFLLQAAGESYIQTGIEEALAGVTVSQVMTHECTQIDGHLNVQHFVDDYLLQSGNRCFLVMDNDGLAGIVTPGEVRTIERARWPYTTIFDVMRPLQDLHTLTPETPLRTALELMAHENLNQMPVVVNGRVVGMFSRAQFLDFLKTRAEFAGRSAITPSTSK